MALDTHHEISSKRWEPQHRGPGVAATAVSGVAKLWATSFAQGLLFAPLLVAMIALMKMD